MICLLCRTAADQRAPKEQHCTDPKCMCGHRTDRYQPRSTGIRGLLEHAGIDLTGRDITVGGEVVDAWADRSREAAAGWRFEGEHGPELLQLPHGCTVHPLTDPKD